MVRVKPRGTCFRLVSGANFATRDVTRNVRTLVEANRTFAVFEPCLLPTNKSSVCCSPTACDKCVCVQSWFLIFFSQSQNQSNFAALRRKVFTFSQLRGQCFATQVLALVGALFASVTASRTHVASLMQSSGTRLDGRLFSGSFENGCGPRRFIPPTHGHRRPRTEAKT